MKWFAFKMWCRRERETVNRIAVTEFERGSVRLFKIQSVNGFQYAQVFLETIEVCFSLLFLRSEYSDSERCREEVVSKGHEISNRVHDCRCFASLPWYFDEYLFTASHKNSAQNLLGDCPLIFREWPFEVFLPKQVQPSVSFWQVYDHSSLDNNLASSIVGSSNCSCCFIMYLWFRVCR